MNKNWGIGLGAVIGSCVIFPLILKLFTHYNINRNDAKMAMEQYMQNSVTVKAVLPEKIDNEWRIVKIRYTKAGDDYTNISDKTFYLPAYHKYFVFEQYDLPTDEQMDDMQNDTVMMRINKDDLSNTTLGTQKKPIPVFNLWPASKLTMKEADGKVDTLYPNFNQKNYQHNLLMYLTFVMPKEEFNTRFGAGK